MGIQSLPFLKTSTIVKIVLQYETEINFALGDVYFQLIRRKSHFSSLPKIDINSP